MWVEELAMVVNLTRKVRIVLFGRLEHDLEQRCGQRVLRAHG